MCVAVKHITAANNKLKYLTRDWNWHGQRKMVGGKLYGRGIRSGKTHGKTEGTGWNGQFRVARGTP